MDSALISRIASVLTTLGTSAPVLRSCLATAKLYEMYIYGLVIRALQTINARLTPIDSRSGSSVSSFVFRLGPGYIYSPTTTPCYVLVEYQSYIYELHNDLQVVGNSDILHELDICLLRREEADSARRARIHPPARSIRLLIECKCYGSSLQLHLGREFLGLLKDFRVKVRSFVSNISDGSLHTYITHHDAHEDFEVTPLNQQRETQFINWLADELRQVLA